MSKGEFRKSDLLDAAEQCFLRHGFQKTTIDAIASTARMSRPAFYQYFDDKHTIFRAVVERLHHNALVAARQALIADAPLDTRIFGAVLAKYRATVELVGRSPHALELFNNNDRIAGDLMASAHTELAREITRTLRSALHFGEIDLRNLGSTPKSFAQLIDHAAQGVVSSALADPTLWPDELHRLISVLIAGVRTT